jgi:hypothetical protein
MSTKGSDETELRVVDRFDGGVGWIAYPDEGLQRASHALVDGSAEQRSAGSRTQSGDDEVWLVDPVDATDLDDLLAEYGEVAGVLLLLDRHKRDADAIARRHDVAVHRPQWMSTVDSSLDAPIRSTGDEVAGYEVHKRIDTPLWREVVLYDPDGGTLLVPESVGTVDFFRTGGERLGVHPAIRMFPPRDLLQFDPERVLVGHGTGVHEDAASALRDAVDGSRRRAPSLYVETLRSLVG